MGFLTSLLVPLAVSADSLLFGIAYGMRGIAVPGASLVLVGGISLIAVGLSMIAGNLVGHGLGMVDGRLSGISLIAIGVLHLVFDCRKGRIERARDGDGVSVLTRIMNEPCTADLDGSGAIAPGEAVLLGIVLAADAVPAALALGLGGVNLYVPLLSGLFGAGMLCIGVSVGEAAGALWNKRWPRSAPAFMLLAAGILKTVLPYHL